MNPLAAVCARLFGTHLTISRQRLSFFILKVCASVFLKKRRAETSTNKRRFQLSLLLSTITGKKALARPCIMHGLKAADSFCIRRLSSEHIGGLS